MQSLLARLSDTDAYPELNEARFALRLADDALIHAQRLCEWSGKAPTLEEDLALANVGLDFLGRARLFYGFASAQFGCSEDDLAYLRDSADYRNLLLVELPRGDFAFTMVRQYVLDSFEQRYFQALATSQQTQFAAIAEKTGKEVDYHLRRSSQWLLRLGLGTSESHDRAQVALEELWGYVGELFAMDALETALAEAAVAVDRAALASHWRSAVQQQLTACSLQMPSADWQVSGGRKGQHTEHLGHLLGEMQVLQRSYPGLSW